MRSSRYIDAAVSFPRVSMLRDFQSDVKGRIYTAWGEPNVFNIQPVLPTGGGKTVLMGSVIEDMNTATAAIAHRQELVSQMALALNRERIPHGIIAPKQVVHQIVSLEHDSHGYSAYRYQAPVRVAGVDTLANHDTSDRWLSQVGLVVQDEGHHVLRENKWGKAMALFPNARGLFPTAHAVRADGAGLGRKADGLVDSLVVGPSCRELIDRGYLTDYRLLCPSTDIDFSDVAIGATGDYSLPQLRAATHSSNRIVGDVVKHYLGYAAGKLGVTFAVDIEAAKELAAAYRAAGVPAEIITGKTPITVRGQLMRKFRNRQILQLVSVDCLGEGVDVPAIEVISMVRKTASFQLYAQQFGRSLRPMIDDAIFNNWGDYTDAERVAFIAASMKPKAIVIDHVGNCMYHGLPDVPQVYSLDRRESGRRKNVVSMLRTCDECLQPYERFLLACPRCNAPYIIASRASPQAVDGDLIELDAEVLAQLRGAVAKVDRPCYMPVDAGSEARKHILRAHHSRVEAQKTLRAALELWGGWWENVKQIHRREAQKRFYLSFGVDVLSAQALDAVDATALEARVRDQLARLNVVAA